MISARPGSFKMEATWWERRQEVCLLHLRMLSLCMLKLAACAYSVLMKSHSPCKYKGIIHRYHDCVETLFRAFLSFSYASFSLKDQFMHVVIPGLDFSPMCQFPAIQQLQMPFQLVHSTASPLCRLLPCLL